MGSNGPLVGVTGEASGSRGNDLVSILHFRHLLKPHQLAEQFLLSANAQLSAKGYLLREGSAVDAALIVRPSSTKNQSGERDPETHQTKNGNHWHFGVKMHIGVDADSGLVHFVVGMAANVNDVTQAHALPHGDEADVVSDAGYRGIDKREGAEAEDGWHVAMRTGKCRALDRTTLVGKLANELEGASHAFVPRSNILFTSSSTTSGI